MRRLIFALALALSSAALACRDEEEPDRVVSVLMRCQIRGYSIRTGTSTTSDAAGAECDVDAARNKRLELTIRTHDGDTYKVEVAPETRVRVGDEWPP
jgi:hypothetical protein